jgi:hypothetical protein
MNLSHLFDFRCLGHSLSPLVVRSRNIIDFLAFFVLLASMPMQIYAQSSVNTAGGTINGSNGNISYTIGQMDYEELLGAGGSASEGVQQVYIELEDCGVTSVNISGDSVFCTGNQVSLSASTGKSFTWSNGATTRQILVTTSGSYGVTVTDVNGCTASSARNVTSCDCATPTLVAVTQPGCSGAEYGSVALGNLPTGNWIIQQTGTYTKTYTGSGSNFTILNLAPGVYRFRVKDSCGALGDLTAPFSVVIVKC